jgi:hypothetical protein
MVSYGATRGSTKDAVVTRQMAGNPTDDRTFDAALGVRRCRERRKCNRYRTASQNSVHVMLLGSVEVAV